MKITINDIKEAVKSAVNLVMEAGVYADRNNMDTQNKTIGLTYNDSGSKNYGNALNGDNLKTDKMEEDNANTYELTLKGGFKCYNITDINGMEVMHYFKRYWDSKSTKVKPKGESEQYELTMKASEFQRFLNRFDRKVSFVIDYHQKRFEQESKHEIDTISIYPVPSTSKFNITMARELEKYGLSGHKVQVIDPDILKKDLRNLRKDTEFIEKNSNFYNGDFAENPGDNEHFTGSVNKRLNLSLGKFKTIYNFAESAADDLNAAVEKLKEIYQNVSFNSERGNFLNVDGDIMRMVRIYESYCEIVNKAKHLTYKYEGGNGPVKINFSRKEKGSTDKKYYIIKMDENPSIDDSRENLKKIVDFLTPYLKKNGWRKIYPIQKWLPVKFEIKTMSNGERMALRGIYNPTEDKKRLDRELEKIKGTAFVIFDDNVSGGATLSDICLTFKEEFDIKNIIPITFGKMNEKWTMGAVTLCQPTDDNGNKGQFNL